MNADKESAKSSRGVSSRPQAKNPAKAGFFRGVERSRECFRRGVTPCCETVRKLPGYRSLNLARRTWVVGCSMRQLRKRRRALLESNSPRNTQLETHRTDGAGRNSWFLLVGSYIGTIDFLMPEKTHLCRCQRLETLLEAHR